MLAVTFENWQTKRQNQEYNNTFVYIDFKIFGNHTVQMNNEEYDLCLNGFTKYLLRMIEIRVTVPVDGKFDTWVTRAFPFPDWTRPLVSVVSCACTYLESIILNYSLRLRLRSRSIVQAPLEVFHFACFW